METRDEEIEKELARLWDNYKRANERLERLNKKDFDYIGAEKLYFEAYKEFQDYAFENSPKRKRLQKYIDMNYNHKKGFFGYIWAKEKFFSFVLLISLLVMVLTVLAATPYAGYELTTTLQICGIIFLVVFGISAFKLFQSYRDYLNDRSR